MLNPVWSSYPGVYIVGFIATASSHPVIMIYVFGQHTEILILYILKCFQFVINLHITETKDDTCQLLAQVPRLWLIQQIPGPRLSRKANQSSSVR